MPLIPEAAESSDGPFVLALARFSAVMAAFGGFETAPRLAVAVSGGADSMALLLLARAWCMTRGGDVLAVTVDHRLRPGSTAEAETVAAWLDALGVSHRIVTWTGPRPTTGVEASARWVRHALLAEVCREHGLLHLLLAHHAGDQRETVTMRALRGPGHGAAGMAALDYRRDFRLLRPLLGFEKAELTAVCVALAQPWVEDPSNASDLYERNRVRKRLASVPEGGLRALDDGIVAAQTARVADRRRQAARMQAWVRLSPLGAAWVDDRVWGVEPGDRDADGGFLARLVCCVGGRDYPPSGAALERVRAALRQGRAGSLGGCVVRPARGGFWVLRERRGGRSPSSEGALWDGRFRVRAGVRLRYPRDAADRAVARAAPTVFGGETSPPAAVLAQFPVVDGVDGVCVSPPLGYDPGFARFSPPLGLTVCPAWLAPFGVRLMY